MPPNITRYFWPRNQNCMPTMVEAGCRIVISHPGRRWSHFTVSPLPVFKCSPETRVVDLDFNYIDGQYPGVHIPSNRHSSGIPRDFFVYTTHERRAFSCDVHYISSNFTAILMHPKDWLWNHPRHSVKGAVVPQRLGWRMELPRGSRYCSHILCKVAPCICI